MKKRVRVNTPIDPDNEAIARKLTKKRIFGKLINEYLRSIK